MFQNNYNTDYSVINNMLYKDKDGNIISSIRNLKIIFEHDNNLNGLFGVDERTDSLILLKNPPWNLNVRSLENIFDLKKDIGLINTYIKYFYHFKDKSTLKDFILLTAVQNYSHPIKTYLQSLEWDGIERIETIFIDYLHANDTKFIRSVSKKTLIGAVGKILEPGLAHDTTIIFSGKQGCGKSLMLKKLGKRWFNDSFDSFNGDEAYIKMAKSWIIELSELTAYNNSNIERIKQVLTSTTDTYRDKYAGESKGHIRDCIFFGTTNEETFLKDETGNRRFIPVKVGLDNKKNFNIHDLTNDIVDQVWAEAKVKFLNGESNHLTEEEKIFLEEYQKEFIAIDELEEEIAKYLIKKIPSNWDELEIESKRQFIKEYDENNMNHQNYSFRNKVSSREIRDVLLKDDRIENKNLTMKINKRLKKLLNKNATEKVNYKKYYGQQRGFYLSEKELNNIYKKYFL